MRPQRQLHLCEHDNYTTANTVPLPATAISGRLSAGGVRVWDNLSAERAYFSDMVKDSQSQNFELTNTVIKSGVWTYGFIVYSRI